MAKARKPINSSIFTQPLTKLFVDGISKRYRKNIGAVYVLEVVDQNGNPARYPTGKQPGLYVGFVEDDGVSSVRALVEKRLAVHLAAERAMNADGSYSYAGACFTYHAVRTYGFTLRIAHITPRATRWFERRIKDHGHYDRLRPLFNGGVL
jgi:hypothetical protein